MADDARDKEGGTFIVPLSDDSGSKDRATVALVDAKVQVVDTKVNGILELLRNMREDVKALATISGQVIRLETNVEALTRRVKILEKRADDDEEQRDDAEKDNRVFRRVHLPTLIFAAVVAIVAIVGLIHQFG